MVYHCHIYYHRPLLKSIYRTCVLGNCHLHFGYIRTEIPVCTRIHGSDPSTGILIIILESTAMSIVRDNTIHRPLSTLMHCLHHTPTQNGDFHTCIIMIALHASHQQCTHQHPVYLADTIIHIHLACHKL